MKSSERKCDDTVELKLALNIRFQRSLFLSVCPILCIIFRQTWKGEIYINVPATTVLRNTVLSSDLTFKQKNNFLSLLFPTFLFYPHFINWSSRLAGGLIRKGIDNDIEDNARMLECWHPFLLVFCLFHVSFVCNIVSKTIDSFYCTCAQYKGPMRHVLSITLPLTRSVSASFNSFSQSNTSPFTGFSSVLNVYCAKTDGPQFLKKIRFYSDLQNGSFFFLDFVKNFVIQI